MTCIRGHTSERNAYGQCVECKKIHYKNWYETNRQLALERNQLWCETHDRTEYNKQWRKENPRKSKRTKEQRKKYNATSYAVNPTLYIVHANLREERIKIATPKWVKIKDLVKIYRNCPSGYHVDHIIPIKGKNVSGLNVPWNLQYLTASENIRKSNKIV